MGKADIVVNVTGRTLHAVSLAARAEAQRLNLQLAYFNGLGRTSFIRFTDMIAAR